MKVRFTAYSLAYFGMSLEFGRRGGVTLTRTRYSGKISARIVRISF